MCGLAGVAGERGAVDCEAMLHSLTHRGPDDEGQFASPAASDRNIWLGHRRLAIIDPTPAGRQPMLTGDAQLAMVLNGEIYNYRELRHSLQGFSPRTGTDTEVALELLGRHGERGLTRLRGMFAIALWNAQRDELLLARDRLGEKPLYYYHDDANGRLLFASEVRTLLASGAVPRRLDPDGLDSYLTFGSVADPYTLVNGIRAVPAGGVVRFHAGKLTVDRYWDIANVEVDNTVQREVAVEELRRRMDVAQRRCLVADVPVGILLSGGIDSSINVALLANMGTSDLRTFSVVFTGKNTGVSEEAYSSLVAERFATQHTTCTVALDDAQGMLSRAAGCMDQPSHDGLNTFAISEAIHKAGLKVAVSGQGSDELFLGYPQRHGFAGFARLARLGPRFTASLLHRIDRWRQTGTDSRAGKLAGMLGARRPLAGAYLAMHSIFPFAALQRLRGESRPHPERFVEPVETPDPLDALSRLQLRHYLKDTLLRDADQMSMAHGLELRAPFIDHDLTEFALTVPARHKLDATRNKPLLLDAVGQALPREIWDRPKQGFAMPVGRWLLDGASVFPGNDIPGLDERAVAGVRNEFVRAGRPYGYLRMWSLEVLGAWLQRHGISSF